MTYSNSILVKQFKLGNKFDPFFIYGYLNKDPEDTRDTITIKKEDLVKIKEAELFITGDLD